MYFKFLVTHSQYENTPTICVLSLPLSLSPFLYIFLLHPFLLTKTKLIFLLPVPCPPTDFVFSSYNGLYPCSILGQVPFLSDAVKTVSFD